MKDFVFLALRADVSLFTCSTAVDHQRESVALEIN